MDNDDVNGKYYGDNEDMDDDVGDCYQNDAATFDNETLNPTQTLNPNLMSMIVIMIMIIIGIYAYD
jgi:hypothetical protein